MFLLFRCLTQGFFNPLCEVFGSVATEAYPVEAEKTTQTNVMWRALLNATFAVQYAVKFSSHSFCTLLGQNFPVLYLFLIFNEFSGL